MKDLDFKNCVLIVGGLVKLKEESIYTADNNKKPSRFKKKYRGDRKSKKITNKLLAESKKRESLGVGE
ncbi:MULTISPECIES: hypothetical protein [unclassified Synechocystis]|uniref:hypothetical protein n=1 Tax=unclassified Synechocystis TaxID=2640012 RepID=UPI00056F8629|nr:MULTISPECIES: hypothetical protein [unclassified Synechocystis]MCT0253968.1 hypothetical protein [Synechocystis sp. CS-94]